MRIRWISRCWGRADMAVYEIGYVEYTRIFMTQTKIAAIFFTIAPLYLSPFGALDPQDPHGSFRLPHSLHPRLAQPGRALAAPHHGHRLDRRLVLFCLAR